MHCHFSFTALHRRIHLRLTAAFLLITLTLTGCSVRNYTKTGLLTVSEKTGQGAASSGSDALSPKKIYQYEYRSSNRSGLDQELLSSFGWSGSDLLLYTLNGGSGEEITVEQVNVRYGFHETAASLGVLNYNHILLSPDGKYVVYDTVNSSGENLELRLYSISGQSEQIIASFPFANAVASFNMTFSSDGSSLFYWFVPNYEAIYRTQEELGLKESYEIAYFYEGFFPDTPPDTLFQITMYSLSDQTAVPLMPDSYLGNFTFDKTFYEYFPYCLAKSVISNSTGTKILVEDWNSSFLFDTTRPCDSAAISFDHFLSYDRSDIPISDITVTDRYLSGIWGIDNLAWHQYIFKDPADPALISPLTWSTEEIYLMQYLITNDQQQTLMLAHSNTDEYFLYADSFSPGSEISDSRDHEPVLLYQTADPISRIFLSPDDKYVILFNMTVRESYKNEYAEAGSSNMQTGESENTEANLYKSVAPGDSDTNRTYTIADYQVTILEL